MLKEKQIRALQLFREGKNLREIEELTGYSKVEDAIERGIKNVDRAIETLKISIEKNLMTKEQLIRAEKVLGKI